MKQSEMRQEPAHVLGGAVAQYFPWLGGLLRGKLEVQGMQTRGLWIRWNGTRWLAILKVWDQSLERPLVAFGGSDTFYGALRNLTSSVSKQNWRLDKFADYGDPDEAESN